MTFLYFLIFPRGSGAYFDGIFDQKKIVQNRRKSMERKLGGRTQKQTGKSLKILKKHVFAVIFLTHAAPCRCWKSYLPYSKRSENIINRKNRKFYIEEAISKKNLNSDKKYFFELDEKIFEKKLAEKIFEKCPAKNRGKSKISIFDF